MKKEGRMFKNIIILILIVIILAMVLDRSGYVNFQKHLNKIENYTRDNEDHWVKSNSKKPGSNIEKGSVIDVVEEVIYWRGSTLSGKIINKMSVKFKDEGYKEFVGLYKRDFEIGEITGVYYNKYDEVIKVHIFKGGE
jgi:hypothetical protein